jgi:hypothetical protein
VGGFPNRGGVIQVSKGAVKWTGFRAGNFPTDAGDAGADQRLVADKPQGELIKIGAKVVRHGRYVAFQMAEVAIPRNLFADILLLIAEMRPRVAATA